MFYSLVFILYPIWILFQQKNSGFHHTMIKSVITSTDLDKSISNNNDTDLSKSDDKSVFIKNKQNIYNGFDLHGKNISFVENENESENENTISYELRKIANYFRKLKQLKLLNSPFVSTECKLKCAKEVLEEAEFENKNKEKTLKKNDFWETYDDVFF